MMQHVIRLAGPVQTWVGYRATHSTAHTLPLPTKSGVAGLVGACIGESDYLGLLDRFTLHIRVDRTNAAERDLQVAVPPPPGRATENWHRSVALHEVTSAVRAGEKVKPYRVKEINLTGGTNRIQFSPDRTFLPHAEFMCVVSTDDAELDDRMRAGFRRPVFMPYLGRMANAPSFPFYLGSSTEEALSLLGAVPHVPPPHDERAAAGATRTLRVYVAGGGYATPTHVQHADDVTPDSATRAAQLDWAKENLTR